MAVFFIQYGQPYAAYFLKMAQADFLTRKRGSPVPDQHRCKALAAGLFGYAIQQGQPQVFRPTTGYIRELEQLPNFSPPDIPRFIAHYIRSNIAPSRGPS